MLGMCEGIEVLLGFVVGRLLFSVRRECCLCLGPGRGWLVFVDSFLTVCYPDLGG